MKLKGPIRGSRKSRFYRPDGATRAFVWMPTLREEFGATVSNIVDIWLEGVGDIKDEERILWANRTNGFELRWRGPKNLDVCYVRAQIFAFRNTVNLVSAELQKSYSVEVELKKVKNLEDCKS